MSKGFKFKLNGKGVVELLKSAEMQSVIEEYANNCAMQAGNGYASDNVMSSDRVKAFVYADSDDARRDNNENNTLLKVIG